MKIKTIDLNAKEWFDKVNGNSYFSAEITLNYGMKSQKNINIPFEYGYGDYYLQRSLEVLTKDGYFKGIDTSKRALWSVCRDNNIILRYSKQENCLKRDLLK